MKFATRRAGWLAAGILVGVLALTAAVSGTIPAGAGVQPRPPGASENLGHAAILEVTRKSADSDELWQREIATHLASLPLREVIDAVVRGATFDKYHTKLAARLQSAEGLAGVVHAWQVPGTALIAVRVDCSEDAETAAAITNSLVEEYLFSIETAEKMQSAESLQAENSIVRQIADKLAAKHNMIADFMRANGGSLQLPANAGVRERLDSEYVKFQLKALEDEYSIFESVFAESQRRYQSMLAESQRKRQILLVIQPAKP